MTREELRERGAAVAGAALARLLDISRRGGLAPLWGALLGEAEARLARYERAAASAGERPHRPCAVVDISSWAPEVPDVAGDPLSIT